MRELTAKQASVLAYLDKVGGTPCTPTEIGIHVGGKPYCEASAWACPKLKALVDRGLAERNPRGHYLLKRQE